MIGRDEEREDRISNEAIVDAYGPEGQRLVGTTTLRRALLFRSSQGVLYLVTQDIALESRRGS